MRVVVALDGTDVGERAVKAVASWAKTAGAEVCLLSILHPDEVHATVRKGDFVHALTPQGTMAGQVIHAEEPREVAAEDRTQAMARARMERKDYLCNVAGRYLDGVPVVCQVEGSEHTARVIVEQAKALGADFIAMGTHSRKGLAHVLMGSVAEAVVRYAEVPVLVVGPRADGIAAELESAAAANRSASSPAEVA